MELTVPWEERTEEAHKRKRAKYHDLAETCTNQGWKNMAFPCGGGMQGVSCPVGVEDARIFGHKGQGEEGSDHRPLDRQRRRRSENVPG